MRNMSTAMRIGGLAIAASLPLRAQVNTISSAASLSGGPGMGVVGTFDGLVAPAAIRAWRFSIRGNMDVRRLIEGTSEGVGHVESSLTYARGSGGAWFTMGAERPTNVDSTGAQPLIGVGLWRQLGRVVLSLGSEAHSARMSGRASALHLETLAESTFNDTTHAWRRWVDSSMAGDSGTASRALRWADVAARATWSNDRLALDARAGVQPKLDVTPRTVWVRATATVTLTPMLAFVAAAGTEPSRGWIGLPSSRFMSLGVRVASAGLAPGSPPPHAAPSAPAFSVKEAGTDCYLLTLRIRDARSVEISGDFTGWRPVSMRQASSDTWQVTAPLTPGSHRANVRIDGNAWIAPPGMSSITDDFNGTVGIFFVR